MCCCVSHEENYKGRVAIGSGQRHWAMGDPPCCHYVNSYFDGGVKAT